MTTHRRGWLLRTGLVALLAAGGGVVAVPAQAAPPNQNLGVNATDVTVTVGGGQAPVTVTVKNNTDNPVNDTTVQIVLPLSDYQVQAASAPSGCQLNGGNEVDCSTGVLAVSDTWKRVIQVKPPTQSSIAAGDQKSGSGLVSLGSGESASFNVTLKGADAAPSPTPSTVPKVTGTVKDRATGAPVADAQVSMQDDQQHTFTTGTDRNGAFRFESTEAKPISPGTLAFVVTKDGYDQRSTTVDARAGQVLSVPIVLAATAASASAAPSDNTSPSPVDSPGAVVAPTVGAAGGSGGGGFSSLLIVIGAILVLLGIGAIALILWRRKADNNPPEDDEGPGPPRRGSTTVPASRSAYRGAPPDATSVLPGGGYGAPTAAGRPLADAPTMMHRPVADEYPDPYGAPDPRTTAQYGPPTQYQPSGGYGAPTGVFPTSGGPYPPGGFGSPAGNPGYTDPTRYAPPVSGGGYAGQGGYDSQPPASGYPRPADPYGTTHTQSHDSGGDNYSSGYSQGGYGNDDEPRGGYQPREGYQPRGGGYQQPPRGGYDTPPEHRRSLDWLDD